MTVTQKIRHALVAVLCIVASSAAMAQGRFSYSADGSEVIDNETSLIWRRCSEGQSWSGSTCTGEVTGFDFDAEQTYVQNQAGWRLPNVKELNSILDRSKRYPAIDSTVFPATGLGWYWSSSVWLVDFQTGLIYHGTRGSLKYMRLVRQ